MGRVNSTSQTADVRGKVGGTVLSSNQQGGYAKGFTPPRQVRTPAQQAQRANFAMLIQYWQSLGATTRAAWTATAKLPGWERHDWWGNAYTLTGQQLFLATATQLQRVGVGAFGAPPTAAAPPPPPPATAFLRCSGSSGPSLVSLTPPYSAGVAYVLLDVSYRIPLGADEPGNQFYPFLTFTAPGHGPGR